MAKLKIELEAIYKQADDALNKVTGSVDSYRKSLVAAGKQGEEFDKAMLRDLTSVGERFGYEAKGLEKALALVNKQMSLLSQGVEADNSQLVKLTKTFALYQGELDKLNEAKAAEAQKTKEQIAAAEEMNVIQKQTIQMLEERSRIQNELNAKNANIGFMMLTGDEVGVANHTLKEYEQELKNVISETGVMSTETQKAYKKYADQKVYVDRLVRSTKESALAQKDASKGMEEYAVAVKNAAPAVDKFAVSTKELDQTSRGYLTRLVTLTKNILTFQLIMGPIRSAISGVKNTLKESVNVAAEAEQTYSKLATVFDGFEKSASRAATSLASALGVAKSTASGALSTVGDLLQAQGMGTAESLSTASRWTSQFYDIINFKDINMTLEEFAQNFMSGAAGNLRNFRTFGSIVKESAVQARLMAQGLDKLTGSELELAKMTTRAEMALEQQKNAMGATQREWDTTLSVTRRLNEAWKEYKENLGDTLVSFIKPIKRDITDLLDRVNKVKRAAKELEGGALTSSVYDIKNNSKDYASFRKDLMTEFNSYEGDFTRYSRGTIGVEDTLGFEALDYVMRMYAADLEDVTNILGNKLPDEATEYLKTLVDARKAQEALNRAVEDRKSQISTASDSYNAFSENLLGITGVKFNASSFADTQGRWSATEAGTNMILGQIVSAMFSDVDAALASIKSSDLAETWGGVIAGALDELDKGELLQGRIDSVRQLFENTWNEFLPDGFTEEEKTKLEEIKATYKGYVDELEEYNEELKRLGSFASALSGLQGVGSSYDVQLAQLGMTDDQKATDNLRRQYAEAYALAATDDERQQIDDAYAEAEQTLLAFLAAQKKYNDGLKAEADEKERLAKYEDAIKSIQESTADYATQMAQIGMTDNAKALDDLRISFEKMRSELNLTDEEAKDLKEKYDAQRKALIALQRAQTIYNQHLERQALLENAPTTYQTQLAQFGMSDRDLLVQQRNELAGKHDPLWVAIQKEIDAFDELEKKTRELALAETWAATGERALGATGTLGSVVGQFTDGEGDTWSDIVNALLTIMENTEGWSDIAATLDQIFEMFEPVVDGFINLILSLPWEDIIYMLKVIATVIVTIMGIIRGIQEVFKWLWDNIKVALNNVKEAILHPITGGNQRSFRSFDNLKQTIIDVAEDVKEEYERIWAVNEKIERNTRKDDVLKTLKELYAAGVINENQFYAGARVIQKDKVFDPVPAGSPKYLSSPSQTSTTISYGGVTLQFNGGDTEEIKRWLLNLFNGNGIPYNTAIGG